MFDSRNRSNITTSFYQQYETSNGENKDVLPFELASLMYQALLDLNSADEPFSYVTEASTDGNIGWLTPTSGSRRDICNLRLVSRRLYNASTKTFGKLLGYRTFCFTRVGAEDLQAIANVPLLKPYIRTFTFHNADFVNPLNMLLWDKFTDSKIRNRLFRAYLKEFQWKKSDVRLLFVAALRRFPNLQALRILDHRIRGTVRHLGEWMYPYDVRIVNKAYNSLRFSDKKSEQDFLELYTTRDENLEMLFQVVSVLSETGFRTQNLRTNPNSDFFGPRDVVRLGSVVLDRVMANAAAFRSLCTLRLTIGMCYFAKESSSLVSFKEVLDVVQSLAHLVLDSPITIHQSTIFFFSGAEEWTQQLLQVLQSRNNLESLTLLGVWCFTIEIFTNFAAKHSSCKLRRLILRNPCVINNSWSLTLKTLSQLHQSALEFAQLHDPLEMYLIPNRAPHSLVRYDAKCSRFSQEDKEELSRMSKCIFDIKESKYFTPAPFY